MKKKYEYRIWYCIHSTDTKHKHSLHIITGRTSQRFIFREHRFRHANMNFGYIDHTVPNLTVELLQHVLEAIAITRHLHHALTPNIAAYREAVQQQRIVASYVVLEKFDHIASHQLRKTKWKRPLQNMISVGCATATLTWAPCLGHMNCHGDTCTVSTS